MEEQKAIPEKHRQLKPKLGLWDAVAINVGAIIGGGIFIATGIIAGLAGSALIISMVLASIIALFTALTFAELTAWKPVEGAVYEYSRLLISPSVGFLTGWMWMIANTFGGSAVSLGFGHYLGAIFPELPGNIVACIICLCFTGLNLIGVKQSAIVNNIFVVLKLAVLGFFVVFGLFFVNMSNFLPFEPFNEGMFYGIGLIFFAFGGFPRIAIIAEEVKDPKRNVPRAVLISLLITAVVYTVVGAVAIGLTGPQNLAASNAPLVAAIGATGNMMAAQILAIGGSLAMASVLLAAVLGVSRMAFSMARNHDMPKILSKVHHKFDTPYIAILTVGIIMSIVVLFADLAGTIVVSTFGLVFTYICANIAALRLKKQKRMYPKIIPTIGLITSILIMIFVFFATPTAWLTGVIFLIIGAILALIRKHQSKTKKTKNKNPTHQNLKNP